jgi:hypothetical protein
MAVGGPIRPTSPESRFAPGRIGVEFALSLAVLIAIAQPIDAQWITEPPPIDPFARVARAPDAAGGVPSNGAIPPPAIYTPPGPMATNPGTNLAGPPATIPAGPPGALPYGPPVFVQGQQPQEYAPRQPVYPAAGPDCIPIVADPSQCQSLIPTGSNSIYRLLDHLEGNIVARGYYRNDQRIEWSGMEETFGAEAVLTPRLRQQCGDFEFIIDSELNINEPYGRNQLLDDAERRSYAANFRVNTFDVSQLALVTNYYDWTFKIGKFATPFGRTYFPLYTNAYWDAPYIRTEVVLWRETGILAHYKSGYFVGDIALTNGGENLDTNSGKAAIARVGLESDFWAIGCSLKRQDGEGSESQKEFGNQYGVDMMFRNGPFQLSSECIFDEYGFGRPGFNPLNITWARSIYYRDVSSGNQGTPCTGIGYYVNLGYADGPWNASLNYGDFYPIYSGTAPNQRVQHRGIVKAAYQLARPLQVYSVLIVENGGYIAQENGPRKAYAVLEGFQFTF